MAETDGKVDLILEELRELRNDTKENGERLARLETQMYSLVGNGQPGRIGLLDRSVEKLQQSRWCVVGVSAGSGGVIGALAWVVEVVGKK